MSMKSNSDGCPLCKDTKYEVVTWNAKIGYDPSLYKVMCKECKQYYFRIIPLETLDKLYHEMDEKDVLKQLAAGVKDEI